MRKPIIKKVAKRILRMKAARPILRMRMIERRLEISSAYSEFYPEWLKVLRYETREWKDTSPDWEKLLENDLGRWNSARSAATNGPNVLITTSVGGYSGLNTLESMLAAALTLRGAKIHVLLCDKHLPGCFMNTMRQFPQSAVFAKRGPSPYLCDDCYATGYRVFQSLHLPIHRHSDLLSRRELREAYRLATDVPFSEIPKYRYEGIAVGDEALASTLHFFARGNLDADSEPDGEAILRRYFLASLFSMYEIRHLLKIYPFSCVFSHHGIYVPHGLFSQVCRQENVRFVSWMPSYRKQTFIFSHLDTYHHTMLSEPTAYWENIRWSPEMEAEIVEYLNSRRYGTRDWISYQDNTEEDLSTIAAELGVDFTKPCIGMLTNVIWDAQVNYPTNAFPNMVEWVLQTVRYFMTRPDLQLIVRVHPAEIQHPIRSRQRIVDEIRRAFPHLPGNIFIISPDRMINTYAVTSRCDSVIIYATKTGLELTCMGIPVIVAGDAWARNKGITLDCRTPEEYFRQLDQLPVGERLTDSVVQRARKYAYHFFFRRMVPLPFLRPPWPYTLELSGLDDLQPGRNVGLDVVCDGILKGKEFIYPYEKHLEKPDEHMTTTRARGGSVSRVGAI